MKIICERRDLLVALDRIARVAKPGPHPILETLALNAEGGGINLTATNLDLQVLVSVAADVSEVGACTLPAEALLKLLKRLPEGVVVELASTDDNRVRVKAKRSQVHFPTLSPDDMPLFLGFEPSHAFALPGKVLARLMGVAFAAPEDLSQSYLCGVCLHVAEDGALCAVATDTHVLARACVEAPDGAAGIPRIIIGLKTAGELARLGNQAGDDAVSLRLSEGMLEASWNGTTLLSKLVEGRYPAYERVLPASSAPLLDIGSQELGDALSRALVITADKDKGIRCAINAGAMAISTRGLNGAEIVDEVDVDFDGERTLLFSAKLATDVLAALDCDVAQIELHERPSGTIWRRPGDDSLFCYLMPMIG